jgi:ribonuclease P protein component
MNTCVIQRLKKRSDFLITAKGKRWVTPNFTLQAKQRLNTDIYVSSRLGFTATKKTGNSVRRNRIRRRLKSAIQKIEAQLCEQNLAKPDYDYVLIARELILHTDFLVLTNELISAFRGVHRVRTSDKATRDLSTP